MTKLAQKLQKAASNKICIVYYVIKGCDGRVSNELNVAFHNNKLTDPSKKVSTLGFPKISVVLSISAI